MIFFIIWFHKAIQSHYRPRYKHDRQWYITYLIHIIKPLQRTTGSRGELYILVICLSFRACIIAVYVGYVLQPLTTSYSYLLSSRQRSVIIYIVPECYLLSSENYYIYSPRRSHRAEPQAKTDTPTEILYNYPLSVRNTYRNGNRQPHRTSNRAIIIYQSW